MRIKHHFIKWALLFFLLASLWQTYSLLNSHFTHTDDTGVAETLLIRTPGGSSCPEVLTKIEKKLQTSLAFVKVPICTLDLWRSRLFIIPSQWTYAPFQFWFTQALLDPRATHSYEQIKYLGRLPSFLFFIAGLGAFYYLLRRKILTVGANQTLALALVTIVAFSLEQRIMSVQMESYAIGLLSNVCVLFGLLSLLRIDRIGIRQILIYAGLVSLGISMQYQAVLLAAAGLAALGIGYFRAGMVVGAGKKIVLLYGAVLLFSYALVGDISRLANRGVMWNAGQNKEYLVQGLDLFEKLSNLFSLIYWQTNYNFYSIVSAMEMSDQLAYVFGFFVTIIALLGIWGLFKNRKDAVDGFILHLSALYFLLYCGMLLMGKLTYSPTRHFLYFLPMVVVLVGYGVNYFRSLVYQSKILDASLLALLISYLSLSLWSFGAFKEKRLDRLNDAMMKRILSESDPDFILLGGYDRDIFFLPSANQSVIYDYLNGPQCEKYRRLLIPDDRKIRFLWFSKRYEVPQDDPSFIKYFTDLVGNCSESTGHSWDAARYEKVKDIVRIKSDTEIDLSNRTQNGANNYFAQLYEINTQFDSKLYPASINEGIDFKRQGYPDFLRYVTGLSQAESWGRWSDAFFGGPVVQFGFRKPLPEKFILEFQAIPYADNGQLPTRIRVGNQEKEIYINGGPNVKYQLAFDNAEKSNLIEFYPPKPTYPRQINPADQDFRKLGLGFVHLRLKPIS